MGVNMDSRPIRDLADDYGQAVPVSAARRVDAAVEATAKDGNQIAADFARESAGRHGKWYHRAFRATKVRSSTWAYGPLANLRQGDMSFEGGSRNQPAHNDLQKSTDVIRPRLGRRVGDAVEGAFRVSR